MDDVTQGELVRRLDTIERRQYDFVSKDVYERDINEIRGDTREIKESQKWAARLIIAQFVTLIIALVIIAIQGMPLP